AFALIQAERDGNVEESLRTASRCAVHPDRRSELVKFSDVLAWSNDAIAKVTHQGMSFQGRPCVAPPEVSVEPITRFVKTGKSGYTEVIGHALRVDGKVIRFDEGLSANSEEQACRLGDTLTALSDLYFAHLRPLAEKLAQKPRSTQFAALE